MAAIDRERLDKLCRLAKLRVDNSEEFLAKMNSVFSWIDQLSKIDVGGIDLNDEQETTYERADCPAMANSRDEVLSNTRHRKFDMFSVPKIVE